MTDEYWTATGRSLGAPGVRRDVGVGKAALGALLVGVLWAQGGTARSVAGAILIAAIATPGPDGKSLLMLASDALRGLMGVWLKV